MIRITAGNFIAYRLPVFALSVLLLSSCLPEQPNGIEGTGGVGTPPPPTITLLSPDCAPRGEQLLNPTTNGDLYVVGQNFQANSVVRWNGSDLPTTFFSSTQL